MAIDIEWLEKEAFGRQLNEVEAKQVASAMTEATFATEEKLMSKGQEGGVLRILRSGAANIDVGDGSEDKITVDAIKAGSLIGELTFLNKKPATADVVATENCTVYLLARESLQNLIEAGQQQLAFLILSTILEHQSGVIMKQRVTLAPELRLQDNQIMPTYAKVVIALVAIGVIYFASSS